MIPIVLNIVIFERGASGVPTSTVKPIEIQDRITSYMHTISAAFGFETMAVSLIVQEEEALDWLNTGLMRSAIVYGPDAQTVWEGYLRQVDATFGQEKRSVSLDDMANRVTVRYTTVLGTPGATATASDTASQALYGIKDTVISLNQSTATPAANLRDRALTERAYPKMTPTTQIATGDLGGVQLDLTFEGWYGTLGWVLTSRTSTTNTDTGTQVGALLATSGAGIGVTNAFLSTSTANIITTGNTDTEFIAPDTLYRTKIETLLSQGDSTGERLAWGVYEDRKMTVKQWAGASPTTITYQRFLGNEEVYNSNRNPIDSWDVRPDAMYQTTDLLDVAPIAAQQDAAARFFVERVTLRIDQSGSSLDLEPSETDALDAQIAYATR